MKAYIILAHGFEETEAIAPHGILTRAGIDVKFAGITKTVTGSKGVKIECDFVYNGEDDADIIILPGGALGVANLSLCDSLLSTLKTTDSYIAAICAAPSILGKVGLLNGKKAACYPDPKFTDHIPNLVADPIVIDGKIITANGAGTSLDFGFALCELLTDKATCDRVKKAMLYE